MLHLLLSVFLIVIFPLYFLSLNTIWTTVALMIMKELMNGCKGLLKAIRFFPKDNNKSVLQK